MNANPLGSLGVAALIVLTSALASAGTLQGEAGARFQSGIVYWENGRLTYVSDEEGNRIPDFSHAGYRGGGVALPEVPVRVTLDPQEGDATERIRQAIESVATRESDQHGHRGAVMLNAGSYQITDNLRIGASGVVLRGAGDGSDARENTILHVSQQVGGTVVTFNGGSVNWRTRAPGGSPTGITTPFVAVGSRTFQVQDASEFAAGDRVIVRHPNTQRWLDAIDGGGTSRDPPWRPGPHLDILYLRKITRIAENTVSIDVPVYNHLERKLAQSEIYHPDLSNLIREVGIEDLRIVIATDGEESENHARHGVIFHGVENGWARGVTVLHFQHTGLGTRSSTFISIQDCRALEPHSRIAGARRYSFNTMGSSNNILFENVLATRSRHCFISNGTTSAAGIVFLDSISREAYDTSEGHRRWSQGLLFDNLRFQQARTNREALALFNRGHYGTAHGWSAAHSVAWNVDAGGRRIFIQKPPTTQNYGIGNQGIVSGDGPFDHPAGHIEGTGQTPDPESLYRAQLAERLAFGTPPDAPTRLAVHVDGAAAQLQWRHVAGNEVAFVIERAVDPGSFEEIARRDAGRTTWWDRDLPRETATPLTCRYRVRAVDAGGKSAWSNPVAISLGSE